MKVRDILFQKGNNVFKIGPDETVFEALKLMADNNVGALVVADSTGIKGILTERDYARKVVLKGRFSKDTLVSTVMNDSTIAVTGDDGIFECMNLMTNNFVRHLLVMDNKTLIGIISIGDVVKYVIQEQQFIIENLDSYISGSKGNM